jgi:glycopeptide antibiotics resistance protein
MLVPAVTPSGDLAFVLQLAAVGALVGAAIAAYWRQRNPAFDAWMMTTRWSLLLAVVGVVIIFVGWLR